MIIHKLERNFVVFMQMLLCLCAGAPLGGWFLDLLQEMEGGWLAKKYFFWKRAGGDIFFARARRAHLRMPRIRLILQIKKNQGKVSQADKRGRKLIFCRLVSYVDRNTNYGMIQPPQLFFRAIPRLPSGFCICLGCQPKAFPQLGAYRARATKVRPHE